MADMGGKYVLPFAKRPVSGSRFQPVLSGVCVGVMRKRGAISRFLCTGLFAAVLCLTSASSSHAMTLEDAIRVALEANPEVGEAIANREAIEFELKQAKGLYLPQLDLEVRNGVQQKSDPGTRAAQDQRHWFNRREGNAILRQLLFDGFERKGELQRQAARVDSASHKVYERSEFIALNVAKEYLDVGLRKTILSLAHTNLNYHKRIFQKISKGTDAQAVSVADRQQAEERVYDAEARMIQAQEDLNAAKIRLFRLVGVPLDRYITPGSIARKLPPTVAEVLGVARTRNPAINVAKADLDAAYGDVKKATSEFLPKIGLEVTGRLGDDLEGIQGWETDYRAEVVMRWKVFNGGIRSANKQEQIRRVDEERFGLHKAYRDVEEAVRLSWDRRTQQRRKLTRLEKQLAAVNRLLDSYTEQFKVGERSLLDVLDTQNSRFATQVSERTARKAVVFAEYRVLASAGVLLSALRIDAPKQSDAYARDTVRMPEPKEAETKSRHAPRRGDNSLFLNFAN